MVSLKQCWKYFTYVFSLALTVFSLIVLFTVVGREQTDLFAYPNVNVSLAVFLFVFLILYLAMLEGVLPGLVGLIPIKKTAYEGTHKSTFRITSKCHTKTTLEEFIIGRQFLVVLVVFVLRVVLEPDPDVIEHNPLGLPDGVMNIIVIPGFLGALLTIIFGQLVTAAVMVPNTKIDFLNNYIAVITVWSCLAIEWIGITHFVYALKIMVDKIHQKVVGKPHKSPDETLDDEEDEEEERNCLQSVWFWFRVIFSGALLFFSTALVIVALFQGRTLLSSSIPMIPVSVGFILFIFFLFFLAVLEGIQISLFACLELSESDYESSKRTLKICKFCFKDERKGLTSFLIGRQVLVTLLFFFLSLVTTVQPSDTEENIFGVPDWFETVFLESGLLASIVTTIWGTIFFEVIAASFPIQYANVPGMDYVVYLCAGLENTGFFNLAWPLAHALRWFFGKAFGWKYDTYYTSGFKTLSIHDTQTYSGSSYSRTIMGTPIHGTNMMYEDPNLTIPSTELMKTYPGSTVKSINVTGRSTGSYFLLDEKEKDGAENGPQKTT